MALTDLESLYKEAFKKVMVKSNLGKRDYYGKWNQLEVCKLVSNLQIKIMNELYLSDEVILIAPLRSTNPDICRDTDPFDQRMERFQKQLNTLDMDKVKEVLKKNTSDDTKFLFSWGLKQNDLDSDQLLNKWRAAGYNEGGGDEKKNLTRVDDWIKLILLGMGNTKHVDKPLMNLKFACNPFVDNDYNGNLSEKLIFKEDGQRAKHIVFLSRAFFNDRGDLKCSIDGQNKLQYNFFKFNLSPENLEKKNIKNINFNIYGNSIFKDGNVSEYQLRRYVLPENINEMQPEFNNQWKDYDHKDDEDIMKFWDVIYSVDSPSDSLLNLQTLILLSSTDDMTQRSDDDIRDILNYLKEHFPKYIPKMMEIVDKVKKAGNDYYKILGVSRDCSDNDLKKAYHKLARSLHPDKNKAPGAEDAFKTVGAAWACLSDSEKRSHYDLHGGPPKMQPHGNELGNPGGPVPEPEPETEDTESKFSKYLEIFEQWWERYHDTTAKGIEDFVNYVNSLDPFDGVRDGLLEALTSFKNSLSEGASSLSDGASDKLDKFKDYLTVLNTPKVGIKNYGNNSYMISVLQGLFHTPGFLSSLNDVVDRINGFDTSNLTPYQKSSLCFIKHLIDLYKYLKFKIKKKKLSRFDTGAQIMNMIRSINPLIPVKYLLIEEEEGDPYEFGKNLLRAIGCVDMMFDRSYTDDKQFEDIFYGDDTSEFRKKYILDGNNLSELPTNPNLSFAFINANDASGVVYWPNNDIYSIIKNTDNDSKYEALICIKIGEIKYFYKFTDEKVEKVENCDKNILDCDTQKKGLIYISTKGDGNDVSINDVIDTDLECKSIINDNPKEEYNNEIIPYAITVLSAQIEVLQKYSNGDIKDKETLIEEFKTQKDKWVNIYSRWKKDTIRDFDIASGIITEIKSNPKLMTEGMDTTMLGNVDILIQNIMNVSKDNYSNYINETMTFLGPCFNTKNYKVSFDHQKSAINSLLNEFNKLSIDFDLANN